jgi:hypothetical protein
MDAQPHQPPHGQVIAAAGAGVAVLAGLAVAVGRRRKRDLLALEEERSVAAGTGQHENLTVRVGVLTPTHDRPDLVRMLAMQMALQERKPDVLCIHQNGDPESYEWAIADLPLPFEAIWIHTRERLPQDEWYSRPLGVLLANGCTHFFWCDDDDIYRSDHLARSMAMLTDEEDPCDLVVNGYSGLLFKKKAGYEYEPCARFGAHAAGGMASSMAFNRAFAEELFQDLINNLACGELQHADTVLDRQTLPKFRRKLDERQTPTTIYVCHPGADSSSGWLEEE